MMKKNGERKLEKWWLEWDPVNRWLQVGGHIKQPDGRYTTWLTSPVVAALGSHLVETGTGSKYHLGRAAAPEKWLVPHKLKKLFNSGFTEDWVSHVTALHNVRMTRHTPHRERPATPIDDMAVLDQNPQAENVSMASTIKPSAKPPKRAPRRPQSVKPIKPKKRTKAAAKKPTKPAKADPLQHHWSPSAKVNYAEIESSDYENESESYAPTPKQKKPKKTRKVAKKSEKKIEEKIDKKTEKKVEKEVVKKPEKKEPTKRVRKTTKRKSTSEVNDEVSPPKKTKPTEKQVPKPATVETNKTRKKKPQEPKVKQSLKARAKRHVEMNNVEQVDFQMATPKRKTQNPAAGGFATPSNKDRPDSATGFATPASSGFRTPKEANSKKPKVAMKTPVLRENNTKRKGFKTPKLTVVAAERKLRAAANMRKKTSNKGGFATPQRKKIRNREDDIAMNITPTIDSTENDENYF